MDSYLSYQSLVATRETADWAFWSMIGTWFSGVATFMAVCVSLHLGLKKPKARISCRVGEALIFAGPYQVKGVSIVITNLALNTVKITSINWVFKKDISFFQPFSSRRSMQLPQKLDYGEQATFWIDLDDESEWIEKIAKGLKEQGGKTKDFRCEVSVTTGESFTFEISESLMNKIEENYLKVS